MEAMILYLLKSSLSLIALYVPFRIFLRKETFFRINRLGLLTIIILAFILPLSDLSGLMQEHYIHLPEIMVFSYGKDFPGDGNPALGYWPWIVTGYFGGATFFLFRKIYEWAKLRRIIRQGRLWVHDEQGIRIHCHIDPIAPFSWMNQIVISEKDYHENGNQILLHETAHIRFRHSWDIIWLSAIEIIQWFNPFVWMLSKDIQDIHEYEADDYVLRQGENACNYQLLLIEKAVSPTVFSKIANRFNSSQIKKRIRMMNKRPSNPWTRLKFLYLIPIVVFVACLFSPIPSSDSEESPEFSPEMNETMDYISRHIKYPTDAIEKGISGRVVLELHLTDNERQNTVKVINSIYPSLDEEAVRIIKETPLWKKGHKHTTKLLIPIAFRLM